MNGKCDKCGKIPPKVDYKDKKYCTWYCAKKDQVMVGTIITMLIFMLVFSMSLGMLIAKWMWTPPGQ